MVAAVVRQHLGQVARAGRDHVGGDQVQAPALPVGQDQERGRRGDRAAHQRVAQARPQQHVAVADQVEAQQRHHRDRRGGGHVAVCAGDEETQRGHQREQQLHRLAREQLHEGPGEAQAHQRAGHTLHQPQPGGAVVGPAHEGGGEQDPEAVVGMDQAHHRVTGSERDGHAQAMAEQQRLGRELLADARGHFAQCVRVGVAQARVQFLRRAAAAAHRGQLAFDVAQVAAQQVERAQQAQLRRVAARAQEGQRFGQVGGGLPGQLAVGERLAQSDGFAQCRTGLALQGKQALAAVQHVAVEERFGQLFVGIVRGAGALVEILRHVIQAQVQARLHARPAGTPETAEDGGLGRVHRGDHLGILFGQRQPLRLLVDLAHRLEQVGLQPQVQAQLAEQPRQPLAHRPVGERGRPQDGEQAVPRRADQQLHRTVPGRRGAAAGGMLVDADHHVDRHRHRGLRDGGIALAERAEQRERERGQRQSADEQPRVREQPQHREGGHGEARQRQQDRLAAALPVVVGLADGAGDDAEEHGRHRIHPLQLPARQDRSRQRDQHAQPVTGFFMRPQADEAGFDRGHGWQARAMPPLWA